MMMSVNDFKLVIKTICLKLTPSFVHSSISHVIQIILNRKISEDIALAHGSVEKGTIFY